MGLREDKKARARQTISNVATALFLEKGFDAVSVADVARPIERGMVLPLAMSGPALLDAVRERAQAGAKHDGHARSDRDPPPDGGRRFLCSCKDGVTHSRSPLYF